MLTQGAASLALGYVQLGFTFPLRAGDRWFSPLRAGDSGFRALGGTVGSLHIKKEC